MEKVLRAHRLLLRSQRLPWIVMALTLAILAGTILLASGQLRRNVRGQMARRDAEVLHAVAQMLQLEVAADLESAADIEDPVHQLTVLFKTSNLGSVLGARLFDGRGRFVQAFQVCRKRSTAL